MSTDTALKSSKINEYAAQKRLRDNFVESNSPRDSKICISHVRGRCLACQFNVLYIQHLGV
jgi:hypothetical protein